MASPSQSTPVNSDTLITVKISYNGSVRRFKLPLRELGASVLPDKLRSSLSIPDGEQVKFERYSDSAAAYVVLDATNPSVYKQLYRAAKAKLKLRLKATVIQSTAQTPPAPPAYTSQVSLISPPPPAPISAPVIAEESTLVPPVDLETPAVPALTTVNESSTASSPTIAPEIDTTRFKDVLAELFASYVNGDEYKDKLRESVRVEVEKQSRSSSSSTRRTSSCTFASAKSSRQSNDIVPNEAKGTFVVYCDHCSSSVDGIHYHCATCDQGNFDLCQACVDKGVHCKGEHWLIKRRLENGQLVLNTTEPGICPKPKTTSFASRTCNCCVTTLPEECFVTCKICEDYDVCLPCHIAQKHGHHPSHGFKPATKDTSLDSHGVALLSPGRGVRHRAVCDGCEKHIVGVRHKCLNCPDWDYCSDCIGCSRQEHPGHRFVPIYEPIHTPVGSMVTHHGIYCDGPLCKGKLSNWINGDRYKCAVCDNTDFCANCEACPKNTHNRSHPLIKMKTPIRDVTCTTIENEGNTMMGDVRRFSTASQRSTMHAATQVQTVADVEPTQEYSEKYQSSDEDVSSNSGNNPLPVPVSPLRAFAPRSLKAAYVKDTIDDGTCFQSGQNFTQTWTLTNSGTMDWPAGVRVSFAGGDHMFNADLEDEEITTFSKVVVQPGKTADFSVSLVAPEVPNGRVISYWRLTAPDGSRFGPKLWCDIKISTPSIVKAEEATIAPVAKEAAIIEENDLHHDSSNASSQMIFPTLEKESHVPPSIPSVKSDAQSSVDEDEDEEEGTVAPRSPVHSPAWTVTLSEDDGHTSDAITTSEDDVESLMLDDEEYEVLETSDDDGYRRVI